MFLIWVQNITISGIIKKAVLTSPSPSADKPWTKEQIDALDKVLAEYFPEKNISVV